MSKLIRQRFGNNPLIVIEDKSTQTASWFHSPTQGIGLRYQLYRFGFRVLLVDEDCTSSSCLDCQGNTKRTDIKRINPHPWQRQLHSKTFVHGLLQCESTQCKSECDGQSKKWNRDLMAICNFRRIWNAYLNDEERPNDLKVQPRNEDGDDDVTGGIRNTYT